MIDLARFDQKVELYHQQLQLLSDVLTEYLDDLPLVSNERPIDLDEALSLRLLQRLKGRFTLAAHQAHRRPGKPKALRLAFDELLALQQIHGVLQLYRPDNPVLLDAQQRLHRKAINLDPAFAVPGITHPKHLTV